MRKTFSEDQLQRYSRQIILTEIGHAGQAILCNSSVLIIGAGGLGSPAALYCAAAGVGTIGIADDDTVDLSNLHRQIIHTQASIGRNKSDSAAEAVRRINSETTARTYPKRVSASSILSIISGYDFVIDASDNFPAKFLINDACVKSRVPFSHAGVLRFFGQTMTVLPGKSACFRCVFGSLPPLESVATCSDAGVLGPVAGVIGAIQATEAIKCITGTGAPLSDTLLTYDALTMEFRKISLHRSSSCAVCGIDPEKVELKDETMSAKG